MPKNNVTLKANYTEKYYTLGLESVWIADEGVTPNYDAFPTMISGQQKKFNEKVTLPICTSVVDEENDGVWNFTGWVESRNTPNPIQRGNITEYTMPAKNVELSAVWTFQKNERVNVNYEYAVDDDCDGKYTLPTELTPPAAESIIKGRTATPKTLSEAEKTYSTTEGTWSFTGWTPEKHENVTENVTFTGKWHFTENEPKETTYSIKYYRQDADGKYSNKPYYTRTMTDAGVPLKGNVGDTVKIEDLEPFYKEHYKGYEFDANNENNVPQCTLQADANKNVLKIYYKALPELEVKKEVDEQYNVKHGDTLTYTITVKNAGARNLTNVKVTDVIDAADPSKLEILPGEGYTYHEESGKIEIGNMAPGDEVVIKATYVVQEADSGHTIKNTATGSADEVEGVQATVSAYPNKIEEFKGDLVISKTYRSDTSTSPAATFYFDVYYMDGDEQISLLDEYAEISFDKNEAKKGAPATKTVEVKLNDVNEKVLESGFYVREVLEDKVDKVVYDRNAVHGFLVPFPLISAYADTDREPITVDREAYVVSTQVYENAGAFWAAWVTDELDENYNVFSFTNTYKTVRTEPVKVGPQLNRDDHVAYIMGYPDGTVQPEGRDHQSRSLHDLLPSADRLQPRLLLLQDQRLYRCERGRLVQQRHLHALQRRYRHGL